MLYLVSMKILHDGGDQDAPYTPLYGLSDGGALWAELGNNYVRACKAYHNMLRTVSRTRTTTEQKIKIAQKYYDMRDMEENRFCERHHYAGPAYVGGLVSKEVLEYLRRNQMDFIEE